MSDRPTMPLDKEPIDAKMVTRERVMRHIARDLEIPVERVEERVHEIEPSVGFKFSAAMLMLHAWHGRVMTGREVPRYVSGHQI